MSPAVPGPSAVPSAGDKKWYVVKVQSGREESIKDAIERRVKIEGLEEFFGQIVIPEVTVAALRKGRKVEQRRKLFPGYVVCEVALDDSILCLFRETPGVSGFVGGGETPVSLRAEEVERMLSSHSQAPAPPVRPEFDRGERVGVSGGMFDGMEGEVAETLGDTGLVRVWLTILGRRVPIEIDPVALRRLD